MATLSELETAGKLVAHEPDFEEWEYPVRWIHKSPNFHLSLEAIKLAAADAGRVITPYEQVEQIFFDYAIGRPMIYERDRRKLNPLLQHVWEFKPPDVRVFGWVPKPRHFVAVCCELKRNLIPSSKYAPFIQQVIVFRDQLALDEPKSVTGIRPDEIS